MSKFYITTSIAYANAKPHIGFALELLQADALARWHGLLEEKRWFLTGTDEHGRKVAKAAEEAGKEPQSFVDETSEEFRKLTEVLDISNDDFIRTSDQERHWPGVVMLWKELLKAGDLYRGMYKGLYCTGCEEFKKPSDLVDGMCPNHDVEPEEVKEENWFFRLSKYGEIIKEKIKSGEFQVVPQERQNEVLSFIDQGLEDLSVSRPSKDLSWGIPVPGDDTQTMYVWVDALSNYITALGYGREGSGGARSDLKAPPRSDLKSPPSDSAAIGTLFEQFWPADVQIIGKDIIRFHAVIWPALLISAGLPLPKKLLVHGFIQSGGQKMSKSVGNVIDPLDLVKRYGVDPVRYYLLHEIPTMKDGDFTEERFREVYAADLQHTIGNLLSRVTKLAEGKKVTPRLAPEISDVIARFWQKYEKAFTAFELNVALDEAIGLARFSNEFIDELKPWESDHAWNAAIPQLALILSNIAWMLTPFLPKTAKAIFEQTGMDPVHEGGWDDVEVEMKKGDPLFPRLSPEA